MSTLSRILNQKLIAIIRNIHPEDILKVCKALHEGGISIMEITLNSPNALKSINEASNALGEEILIGAGTVLDSESARAAISAGAKFIISPTVNIETIKTTKRYGITSIPGAFTPTEILLAYENGADIIKVFPASLGPNYIKDILAPLSPIPLLATGGVNINNVIDYMSVGVVGCGIGSSLVSSEENISPEYLSQITYRAQQFSLAINEFRN
ncbi:bifunctional 4-hydroxy-2-oxoglutarate aldolase/2-dehydro-3-deoxy-phosphogluconate aldolase [Bacillus sp. FJAT-49711]|uniref:bifunctional 4-hydroxy-2-oxoglutarate aldolase/2-dehydro-3-deoxy-phosphogluconate aldolase n=1 Tax=Bacillus sp. FJAT-49711 TaxID=2833585 RepID=UPI001BC934A2|nr:bifunctional 4-hydroxy-2-oxoglutarate aldolase/2-dehydro-3-deoxy-phosphogluconate aldolase [Bacillus sp. FJAT-49711]MBS4219088.1 bifunctional 4-hydroxy-2-oxoglutarate aldolase/2-dehydro-3-deoxy-phosphogluconate aldolase [Bacillus sp. FJAT-49711]